MKYFQNIAHFNGTVFSSACERRLSHQDITVFYVVKIELACTQTGISFGGKDRQTKIEKKKTRRAGEFC